MNPAPDFLVNFRVLIYLSIALDLIVLLYCWWNFFIIAGLEHFSREEEQRSKPLHPYFVLYNPEIYWIVLSMGVLLPPFYKQWLKYFCHPPALFRSATMSNINMGNPLGALFPQTIFKSYPLSYLMIKFFYTTWPDNRFIWV